ncbi:MAG: hypothetical protein KC800_01190 [Candidatus Eremiobacteraeota bacterium]|nr:hypothetical protein [Candidatus Eremiobacteraeota bacterium]
MNNTEKLIVPDRRLSKAMKLVLIALSTVLLGCNLWASMTNHQGPVELNIASTLYLAGLAYIWLKSTPFEASEVESLRFQIQGIWVKLRSGSKRLYLSEFVDLTSLREQLEERVLPRLENDLTRSLEVGERYRCKPERKHLILVLFILSVLIAQVSFADALIPLAAIVLLRVWEKRSRRVDFIDRDGVTLTDGTRIEMGAIQELRVGFFCTLIWRDGSCVLGALFEPALYMRTYLIGRYANAEIVLRKTRLGTADEHQYRAFLAEQCKRGRDCQ